MSRSGAPTLSQALREHALALNLVRLVLALLVLVSHSWTLGGWGPDPEWPTLNPATTLGGFAVGGFFALSGMLVTMSGMRNPTGRFVGARALRILPAYLVVLVATAVALAPAVYLATHGSLGGYVTLGGDGPVTYVLRNSLFPISLQYGIHDVFATTTPYGQSLGGASVINGSLWTLPLEVRCYVIALLVIAIGRRTDMRWTIVVGLTASGAMAFIYGADPTTTTTLLPEYAPGFMMQLLFVFLCGALLGHAATFLSFNWDLITAAVVVFVVTSLIGGVTFSTFGLGSLAVLLPAVARLLPVSRVGVLHNDISYGTYIWAFPVQQTLAFAGLAAARVAYMSLAAVVTLGLATASWLFIERPALGFKRTKSFEAVGAQRIATH